MNPRKKILIVGSAHPYRGGLATFNERLAAEYQQQGHEVEIMTFTLQYPNFLFPGKTQFSDEPAPEGLRITRQVNSVNPFNWWKIGRKIRQMEPDLLIFKFWIPFIGPSLGTLARISRRNRKTRVLVIVDNLIPHEKRIGDMALTRYFTRSVHGMMAMSESVLQDIHTHFPAMPTVYAPHPIYDNFGAAFPKTEARAALGLEADTRYLLFFGFIRHYKGLDLLLDALADPRVKALNVKAVIAGEYYTDSKPYLEQIERLGIGDRVVQRTDFIPNSEVGKYFCACDIVVQPYWTATQSGVTQIAYHFGRPMIVTDVAGLPEIVPDGKVGYVVKQTPQDLATAIVRFYEENREAEFSAAVEQEKARFSWAHFTEVLDELADKIKIT